MGHLSPTSLIEEVNCLIVKDILLQILGVYFSVIITKPKSARQRGLFDFNCGNSVQPKHFFLH